MYYRMGNDSKIYEVEQEISQRGIMPWEHDCDNLMRLAIAENFKREYGYYYDKEYKN